MYEKVGETKEIIEANVTDAPVKDIHWRAQQAQTDSVPIIDPGVGKAMVLRHFFFKQIPLEQGQKKPSKLELINHYKRLIEMTLWGDGLIIREDKPIELQTLQGAKKVSKTLYAEMVKAGADFVILLLATPRKGVVLRETPQRAI